MNNPLANTQYNYPLPKVPITASQVGTRILVSLGGTFQQSVWVELSNESPYVLSIYSLQGILLNSIQPQICDTAQIPSGDSAFIIIPNLLIPQASPSSEVDINVYPFGQPSGAYPFPLARQAAPTARSSSAGFEANLGFSVTATNTTVAWLNILNPSAGTTKFTFFQAIIYLVATVASTINARMGYYTGGAAISGAGGVNGPTPNNTTGASGATVAAVVNSATGLPGNTVFYENNQLTLPAGQPVTYLSISFPDQKEVPPNTNFFLHLFNDANAVSGFLKAFWQEN